MFPKTEKELQRLKGKGKNTNFWKNRARIPTFGWVRSEFQCLERKGKKPPMFKEMGQKFQCLEG